jgi:hypothetical protein
MLELAERGGVPCGWILEIVARQPDLLSRGGKGAEEGNKPGVGRSVACNDVVGDAKSALVVGLVQAHVNPGAVLLVPRLVGIPSALQQCQCDLVVDVLLEHVLVRELHMPIDVLQPGRLAKADELIVDEAILDVVELVHVLHNGLTLILYKVLDKSISADGNPKANLAVVNHKRRGREQGTEVREGGIGNEQALCGSVRISRRDTLHENLGLVIEGQASVLLENLLDVREHL